MIWILADTSDTWMWLFKHFDIENTKYEMVFEMKFKVKWNEMKKLIWAITYGSCIARKYPSF